MSHIAIFGAGGFGLEVASYLKDIGASIGAIVDEGNPRLDHMFTILGADVPLYTSLGSLAQTDTNKIVIAVGDPLLRRKIALEVKGCGLTLSSVIHPSAYVASTSYVAEGCILAPFSFVGPYARLDENVAVNVRASVGHDAHVQAHSVLSPHVALNGDSCCEEAAFLGAGAVMLPSTRLGAFSKLSAGSVLKEDSDAGFLLHGNPAKGRQMFAIPDSASQI